MAATSENGGRRTEGRRGKTNSRSSLHLTIYNKSIGAGSRCVPRVHSVSCASRAILAHLRAHCASSTRVIEFPLLSIARDRAVT